MLGQIVHIAMRFNRLFLLAVFAGLAIWAGCETAKQSALPPLSSLDTRLKPGPNDPRIAYVTARLLEEFHYLQRPLDKDLSVKFFNGYIDSLDPRHENFLQSDLAEFDHFRTNLDVLTTGGHGTADLTPAFVIYQRYADRFQQHAAYVNELLAEDKFKFTSDEKIELDRRHDPFPKDLTEAQNLWRQRLRYEYLQDKLSREISETNGIFTVKLPADATTNIVASLERHNRWNMRAMTNADSDFVLQAYLNALAHAYDPHSDYFSAPHAQDFSINMSLSLFGIGAQLSEDDGYCTIRSLVPGGPATKSKLLKENDRIVAVAQGGKPPVEVVDMELEKVVQLIRGPKNTEVRLTISPAEDRAARRVVTLIRDEIKLEDAEAKAQLIETSDGHGGTNRIGVIDLPSFYATIPGPGNEHSTPKYTSEDVAKLLKKLKAEKVAGIILDLRSNPGGSLEECIKLTGLFIKGGPVVLARNPDGNVTVDSSDSSLSALYDGPLVVMINRFSASASEIAAAALQDYGRALVVGDISTHGKGTVQNLNPLRPFVWPATADATNDPGTIKITIRKFYRVSGASTQLKGVVPDIIFPDVLNYSSFVGETALENPLPWDTIKPAKYDKLNLVEPYLGVLHQRSDARLATNQDFAYIHQDIDDWVKMQAEKTATINEHEAIKEREQHTTLNIEREKERAARTPPAVKIYDVTVENADEPGLKEHVDPAETNTAAAAFSSTNSVTISPAVKILGTKPTALANSPILLEAAKKKTSPAIDPMLDETERILEDYISLLNQPLIANH
jgi:carboxyl-terminal processing protease